MASLKEYENGLALSRLTFYQHSGQKLTKGRTIQLAVEAASDELQLVSPFDIYSKG